MNTRSILSALCVIILGQLQLAAADLHLIDMQTVEIGKVLSAKDAQLKIISIDKKRCIRAELEAEKNWPGLVVYPEAGSWDLSAYAGVAMTVQNNSMEEISVALRVDNHGANGKDNCNTETMKIPSGATATLPVTFGRSYGNAGPALNLKNIIALQIFGGKARQINDMTVCEVFAFEGTMTKKLLPGSAEVKQRKKERVQVESYPVKISIEEDPAVFEFKGGGFTKDPQEVIAGAQSLLGDTADHEKEWFEYAHTKSGFIVPGFTYQISFKYRVMRMAAGTQFYAFLRSESQGWGKSDRGWTTFERGDAELGVVKEATFETGITSFNDYQLYFGIKGDARVVVDEITISKGAAFAEEELEERDIKAIPKTAVLHKTIDFESPKNSGKVSRCGSVVSQQAISGSASLMIESLSAKGKWNSGTFLSGEEIFPSGYTYHVYMSCRAIKWTKNSHAYAVVKRTDVPGEKSIVWKRWKSPVGKKKRVYFFFDVAEGQGAKMEVALYNKAQAMIDDIVIMKEPLKPKPIVTHVGMKKTDANLVWSDEFNGTEIDTSKWNVLQKPRTGGWWHEDSLKVEDGKLVMSFFKAPKFFSMGAIDSKGKHEWKYGYFEARIKLPKEQGHWPGFWLFSDKINTVGNAGRDGTEIDIVEAPWHDKEAVSHALHWDGYNLDHKSTGHHVDVPGVREGYHTFAVDWSPYGYIFYVDGKETWRTDAGGVTEASCYFIMSDEMGGWSGDPKKAKNLPDNTYVDYIRVWQSEEYKKYSQK